MFGAPERINAEGEVKYYVSVDANSSCGVQYELIDNCVVPNIDYQDKFLVYKNAVLAELVNHTDMFKKPPTLEYLQAITPNWGCIIMNNKPTWNPYTLIKNTVHNEQQPCSVDLTLTGLYISRSTISPQFETTFLEKMPTSNQIDIDWSANPILPEVEEVSDISIPSEGFIELRDPAAIRKAKMEAKLLVKTAFQRATIARDEALQLAKSFTDKFEVSDNESMFSEWLEGSGSENEEEPEIAVEQS